MMPEDLVAALESLANGLFGLLLLVGTIFIILGGYKFLAAAGDPEKIEEAKRMLLYGVVGMIVAFLAKAIALYVPQLVGV